ncbi:MAG: hypothetical protein KAI40_00390 [Desulfobacterales bacterium]|nr:hypothetical protein [Desulfobacterales bacterium]
MSYIIAATGVVTFYFNGCNLGRLGAAGTNLLGIINLGGDSYYFGDILLFASGAVLFLTLKNSQKRYVKFVFLTLLFLWSSAIILTFTKGLIIAAVAFMLLSIFFLKGKRIFVSLCLMLFMVAFFGNSILTKYVKEKKVGQNQSAKQLFLRENQSSSTQHGRNHVFGYNSLYVRLTLVEVSLAKSIDNFWFGHGAGLSKYLLPDMVLIEMKEDAKVDIYKHDDLTDGTEKNWQAAKRNLIDSHVFFLTEFFNVGILGACSLICLVLLVIVELIKVIKTSVEKNDHIPSLLLASIIAMLIFRLFGSLISIPFLWFMLGFAFGVSQIYRDQGSIKRILDDERYDLKMNPESILAFK